MEMGFFAKPAPDNLVRGQQIATEAVATFDAVVAQLLEANDFLIGAKSEGQDDIEFHTSQVEAAEARVAAAAEATVKNNRVIEKVRAITS